MINVHGHTLDLYNAKYLPIRVLDLGANQGQFAGELFHNCSYCEVTSYEPTPNLVKSDRKNWTVVNKAIIANDDQQRRFFINPEKTWENNILSIHGNHRTEISVPCDNIRRLIKETRFSIIKMDIEGTEYEIFETLTEEELLLCPQWTVEFHEFLGKSFFQRRTDSIIRKFLLAGFQCYIKDRSLMDVLFIR